VYISNEENPNLYYDPLVKKKNTINLECLDIHVEKPLSNLTRENMDLLKYYRKRRILFSKYDESIQLDRDMHLMCLLIMNENFPCICIYDNNTFFIESWYSVNSELFAKKIAEIL